MSAGIKANNDGSAAIQVGGTDYITISSTGAVAMPVSLTIAGQPAGGNYALQSYVAPATWTKPTGLKAIKVTVVGAGGNAANIAGFPATNTSSTGGGGGGAAIDYIPAPSIPGPVAVTAGPGTNSFGAFCSATAGAAGVNGGVGIAAGGAGGSGSGGTINISGRSGGPATFNPGNGNTSGGGGSSILGFGGAPIFSFSGSSAGLNGAGYGGGGGGGVINGAIPAPQAGGTGTPGIVIVEEFY